MSLTRKGGGRLHSEYEFMVSYIELLHSLLGHGECMDYWIKYLHETGNIKLEAEGGGTVVVGSPGGRGS